MLHESILGLREGHRLRWQPRVTRRRSDVRRWPSALSRFLGLACDTGGEWPVEPGRICEGLAHDGVARVEGVLERERCARVHREVLRQFESCARPPLGNIHSEGKRLDLPLRMTGPMADALVVMVARLGPALVRELGADARLVEFSVLQALPGAVAQPPHPDVGDPEGPDSARLVTVFVALVDVTVERGPLEVWPGSHASPGRPDDADELVGRSSRLMVAPAGTAVLMDARTWHRGTANTGSTPRPVLYASWLSSGGVPRGPTWSMHDSIPTSLTLNSLTPHPRKER